MREMSRIMQWLNVKDAKPKCSRNVDALGTPVLIWPRNPTQNETGVDGFAYYGRRVTGKPTFYIFGAEVLGVTHWMPLPNGP